MNVITSKNNSLENLRRAEREVEDVFGVDIEFDGPV
jgi:hypothetical protein